MCTPSGEEGANRHRQIHENDNAAWHSACSVYHRLTPPQPPPANHDPTAGILRILTLLGLTALALLLTWQLTAPFLSPFTWALALAVAFSPVQKRLARRMSPSLAAFLVLTLAILIIAIPITALSRQLFQESLRAQSLLQNFYQSGAWSEMASDHKWVGKAFVWADKQLDLTDLLQRLAATFASSVGPVVATSLAVISQAGTAILTLFFFLRDEDQIVATMRRMLPLHAWETDLLFGRIASAVQSAVYGRLLIGLLQGALGGVIFAIVGLPAPVFWGAVMSILSTIPVLGAFVVWIPAAIFLATTGHGVQALIVSAWGFVIIHPTDNLLYPILVGARLGLHPMVLFVAFVGGLVAFGPSGLILGPCIIAFAAGIAEVWQARNSPSILTNS